MTRCTAKRGVKIGAGEPFSKQGETERWPAVDIQSGLAYDTHGLQTHVRRGIHRARLAENQASGRFLATAPVLYWAH